MATSEAQKNANKKWRRNNMDKVLETQRHYRKQQNKQNTICEESIITIEGKEYKQIVRRGKNWVSTYQVACQSQ